MSEDDQVTTFIDHPRTLKAAVDALAEGDVEAARELLERLREELKEAATAERA